MGRCRRVDLFGSVVVLVVCLTASPLVAQESAGPFAGLRLEAALRAMQARGLRIVFSSELVTPDMRVTVEPRAKRLRDQLDELVAPHGLRADDGPAGVIVVVRRPPTSGREPAVTRRREPVPSQPVPDRPVDDRPTVREWVRVPAPRPGLSPVGGEPGLSLGGSELATAASAMADDPVRIVQAWPGAMGLDDFRSDLSVRGSPYRHVGVVIDGIATPWLQHAASDRGDTGTLSMIGAGMVGQATLRVGAYPRRHADRLGAELELDLREGSRAGTRFRAGVSGTNATVAGEGPLGAGGRGSWIVALRKSYVEWPVGRSDHRDTIFGFADGQAKLVFDVTATQQMRVTMLAGRSAVERETADVFGYGDGSTRAAVVNAGWRSLLGARTVLSQRAALVAQDFANTVVGGSPAIRGSDRALIYRADIARSWTRAVVETGMQVQERRSMRAGLDVSSRTDAAYLHVQWHPASTIRLAHGVRLARSTLSAQGAADWWVYGQWAFRPLWTLHGSAGASSQFPDLERVRGQVGGHGLRPERAMHVDLGVGRQLPAGARWETTVFVRRERDVLRGPDVQPVSATADEDLAGRQFRNALDGLATGVELFVERPDGPGLSGWIAYTFGSARSVDVASGEAYRSDFDQRHAVSIVARYRVWNGTMLGATFRGGSNVPVPGYVANGASGLVFSTERNSARLPGYARLDMRAEQPLGTGHRSVVLFVEVINLLNRANVGPADGAFDPTTGTPVGFIEPLFPRLVTAGFRVTF